MTDGSTPNGYAVHPEPAALRVERLLPGPIERVWSYLTDSELRRRWLAAGDMDAAPGSAFEFVWRNDELTDPPGNRPPEASAEFRLACRIIVFEPPTKLVIGWGETGEVSFTLQPKGGEVLLTLDHLRARNREMLLNVTAGWHVHLDILAARLTGTDPEPFWDRWSGLKREYEPRLPA